MTKTTSCLLSLVLILINATPVLASSTNEQVVLVYIHGTANPESESFHQRFAKLHASFTNKMIGDLVVAPDFVPCHWGGFPADFLDHYTKGITAINSEHGKSNSGNTAREIRKLIHGVGHDLFWLQNNTAHMTQAQAVVRQQIQNLNGRNFILVGHSAGSVVAYQFIRDHIFPTSGTSGIDSNSFRGFISIGSPLNTVMSTEIKEGKVARQILQQTNSCFWINLSHFNDPIAVSIVFPENIPARSPEKFLTNVVTKRRFVERIWVLKELVHWENHVFNAHSWYLECPDEFVTLLQRSFPKPTSSHALHSRAQQL
jgi:pimeloyl-ACP methyl ester carboxylesterase